MSSPSITRAEGDGIFSRTYLACTMGLAGVLTLVALAALALGTVLPVAVQRLNGVSLYALAFGGFMCTSLFGTALAGAVADRRGPASPLVAGLALFTVGLMFSGAATAMWQLILGRCVQGLGGGMILVVAYVVVGKIYPPSLRARMFSLVSALWIVPSIVGPALAGVVVEVFSWRWVFFGLAVLAVAAVVPLAGPLRRLGATGSAESRSLQVVPAGLTAVAAGLLQYASSGRGLAAAATALVGLALLAATAPRLLPAGTLRGSRGLPSVVLLRGLSAGAYFTLESFIPLLLIEQRHFSPALAGTALTGAALTWALGAWLQGHSALAGARYVLVAAGSTIVALAAVTADLGLLDAAPSFTAGMALVLAALGMGLVLPSIGVLILNQAAPEEQGRYTASAQLADGLGSILVIGAAGALFHAGASAGHGTTTAFISVFGIVGVVAVLSCAVAVRIRPVHRQQIE